METTDYILLLKNRDAHELIKGSGKTFSKKKKRRKNPANWVERTQLSNKTIVFKTFLQTFLLEGVGLQLLRKQCRM